MNVLLIRTLWGILAGAQYLGLPGTILIAVSNEDQICWYTTVAKPFVDSAGIQQDQYSGSRCTLSGVKHIHLYVGSGRFFSGKYWLTSTTEPVPYPSPWQHCAHSESVSLPLHFLVRPAEASVNNMAIVAIRTSRDKTYLDCIVFVDNVG